MLIAALAAACNGAPAAATSAPATAPAGVTTAAVDGPTATEGPAATGVPALANTKLNLNTASAADFLTIPEMSDRMVREFQEYRPYVSIAQFRREIGKYVDDAQVAAYEAYVYVPVAVNDSDAATLQQLPGVDETIAAALIAGRPYASPEAFLTALAGQVSADQAAAAAGYLAAP